MRGRGRSIGLLEGTARHANRDAGAGCRDVVRVFDASLVRITSARDFLHVNPMNRAVALRVAFFAGMGLAAVVSCSQQAASIRTRHAVRLHVTVQRSDTGEQIPARVYLFKGGRAFRLSPVDSMLPLRPDLFYRERVWQRAVDSNVLEVTVTDRSHFVLLSGAASFELPASNDYRIEAYHGTFFRPAVATFPLEFGEDLELTLNLDPIAPDSQEQWLAGDDHIHLVRKPKDDPLFLRWMQAEDLAVANFLELQRQQHAAMQWGFGEEAEARVTGYSIRSGHESRSRFYGHTLFLGPSRMIEPLSIGLEYANTPQAFPNPMVLFTEGRRLGALTGFAHFYGSQPNSTLLMNLAHDTIDFVEVFQFGVLKTAAWYELLNAGFRVVGLAGSDFPANLGRFESWPRVLPLLGPERALVRAQPGASAYTAWAEGVRRGEVLLTNGPLLEFSANSQRSGARIAWSGDSHMVQGRANAAYFRPIERIEIVRNGEVVAQQRGDGSAQQLPLDFRFELKESSWIAARVTAESLEGEPVIQAHTNPIYFQREGQPVRVDSAHQALQDRWRNEVAYYRSENLKFPDQKSFQQFLAGVNATSRRLAR